jgi:flagellar biosynthesis protein FliQ
VLSTIVLLTPWILATLREYTASLFSNLAAFGLSG